MVLIKSLSRSSATPTTSAAAAETDHSIADWAVTLPARIGVLRLLAGVIHAVEGLSTEVANYYSVYWVTPRTLQAWLDEGKGTSDSLDQAGAVHSFGALPLIVLSRDPLVDPDPDWQRKQTELLKLSSSSQQLFADKSGHSIEFDQPDAAVGAIEKMVEQARAQTLVAAR